MTMRRIVGLKIGELAIFISFGNIGLFKQNLAHPLSKAAASFGNRLFPGLLDDPSGSLAFGTNFFSH
jgi:hypothetical protein